jgi:heme a synthase
VVVFALLGCLVWFLWQLPAQQLTARWLGALLVLQLITGLSNVVLGWPMLAALAHTGGAAALAVVLMGVLYPVQPRAAQASQLRSSVCHSELSA